MYNKLTYKLSYPSYRIHLFSTSEILPPHVRSQSTSICFVVLIVRSRSALLRAISIFFLHHLVNVYVCAFSLILLLQKGHRCSAGYLRNQ